jgi:cyclic pyranopterin phosphate synthase
LPIFPKDGHGRRISYLRLSVTDRCNLRCQYCMPAEGIHKLQHGDVLSFEEMHRIARLAVSLGIEKIRITGGEPLVRKGLVDFLGKLSALSGLRELVLTTNGLLLREYAAELRSAGVHRINMSLDSLQPQTFSALTRGGDLNRALDGMAAAGEAGFPPVKINAVVIRGMNDGELLDFAALTLRTPHQIRFIEYMPTNMAPDWPSAYVSGTEILERIGKVYPLEPQPEDETAGPAKIFKIPGSLGSIGVITPISSHFCDTCNRLRITASGVVKGCLFDHGTVSLKPYLERNDAELREFLLSAIRNKPDRHHLLDPEQLITPFSMAQIGG